MAIASVFSSTSFAQGQGQGNSPTFWKVNGNSTQTTEFMGTTNNTSLIYKTNNLERMRLTNDGRVGILTDNPLEQIHL